MRESKFKSYEDLPQTLSAPEVAEVLGISRAAAYALVRSREFPSLKVGTRILVPTFREVHCMDRRTDGGRRMKKYQPPSDNFFRLPNNIFDIGLSPIQFTIYAYLVCCAGNKGYCWPSMERIARKIGAAKTSVQEHLKVLQQRQIISKSKRKATSGHRNNVYTLLDLNNPEVYRDLTPPEELPLFIGEELPL